MLIFIFFKSRVLPGLLLPLLFILLFACSNVNNSHNFVTLEHREMEKKVDVFVGDKYFTSYLYSDEILTKPVLFPVHSSGGKTLTRGFPLATRPGERIDHTHHYGIWFNHGDVNGIDFWNAGRTPPKSEVRYGTIVHQAIVEMRSGETGELVVTRNWVDDLGEILLQEKARYQFRGDAQQRTITHRSTLTAVNKSVLFRDSKEGLFAIRVTREMEIASDEAAILTGADLQPGTEPVVDKVGVSGHYRSSAGVEGYPDVWGTRAKWMQLQGMIDKTPVSICIFDAEDNPNHPAHWMARDYGLFGVNNLGSAIYTEGKETFNFELAKNASRTFTHQIIITEGVNLNDALINSWYEKFTEELKLF